MRVRVVTKTERQQRYREIIRGNKPYTQAVRDLIDFADGEIARLERVMEWFHINSATHDEPFDVCSFDVCIQLRAGKVPT